LHSLSGRHSIVYNGEIYNYRSLRDELVAAGVPLRTQGDTEVILALYAREGAAMLNRLRGMFAITIWDHDARTLFLARDPFGIKPLYYSDDGARFAFASQVRALLADPSIDRRLDPAGYAGFRLWGSVPEPFTMFAAIRALPAGHHMTVHMERGATAPQPWCPLSSLVARPADPVSLDFAAAMRDSVSHHMVADVEVGCFLSAGVDSGALLGLLADCGFRDVRTITMAFDAFAGTPYDEAPLAAEIAAHYGMRHEIHRFSDRDIADTVPRVRDVMDQPSVDGVNTWLVSRAAHQAGLKVVLSGLGGDELLAGYPSFAMVPKIARWGRLIHAVPPLGAAGSAAFAALAGPLFPANPKLAFTPRYSRTVAAAYLAKRALTLPEKLVKSDADGILAAGLAKLDTEARLAELLPPEGTDDLTSVALLEAGQYMRNQLLRDSDWAGMAHSLELRVPFVDVPLWSHVAPHIASLGPGQGKAMLANAPQRPLPAAVVNRPKTGFGVPVNASVAQSAQTGARPQMQGWADDLLRDYAAATGLDLPR
jgi:asparagine synthase (glutamine-hydrolysing)